MLVLDKLTKKFDGETILDSLSFTFDDTGLYFLKGKMDQENQLCFQFLLEKMNLMLASFFIMNA